MFEHVTGDELADLASRAGREVARKYPSIQAEDIASEALVRVYGRAARLSAYKPRYLYEVLRREGLRYAAQERYRYIVGTSQYIYTPREVRALLEHYYYDPSMWEVPTGRDDWLSAEIDGQSIGVSLMDIQVALEKLRPDEQAIIEERYHRGGVNTSSKRKRLERAIDALTRALNRKVNASADHEGPGSRRAASNYEAQGRRAYKEGAGGYERDAVDEYHDIRVATDSVTQNPPGTFFDWNKYTN